MKRKLHPFCKLILKAEKSVRSYTDTLTMAMCISIAYTSSGTGIIYGYFFWHVMTAAIKYVTGMHQRIQPYVTMESEFLKLVPNHGCSAYCPEIQLERDEGKTVNLKKRDLIL